MRYTRNMMEKFDLIWHHIFIRLNRHGDYEDVLLVTIVLNEYCYQLMHQLEV